MQKVLIFGVPASYRYLFYDDKGKFELPDFNIPISFVNKETTVDLMANFVEFYLNRKKAGNVEPFFKKLARIIYCASFTKRVLVKIGERDVLNAITFAHDRTDALEAYSFIKVLFSGSLKYCSKPEKGRFNDFCEKQDRKLLLNYVTELCPVEIEDNPSYDYPRYFPLWSERSIPYENLKKEITSYYGLSYVIKSLELIEKQSLENRQEYVRFLFTSLLSDKFRNSALSYYLLLKNPSLSHILTENFIKSTFSKDFDFGYKSSSIARRLYIRYGLGSEKNAGYYAKNASEATALLKAGRKIENLYALIYAHSDSYEGDDLYKYAYLSAKNDNLDAFFAEAILAVKGSAYNNIPALDYILTQNGGVSELKKLYSFLTELACLGFCESDHYTLIESLLVNVPIFTEARLDFEKEAAMLLFSEKNRSIHGCDAHDFYKFNNKFVRNTRNLRRRHHAVFDGYSA